MAVASRAMTAIARPSLNLASNSRIASRAFSTASAPRTASSTLRYAARPTVASTVAASRRLALRRAYSAEAPQPKPKPGKLRKTFRWVWRLTYLSALGLIGYTVYVIYNDKHPGDQFEPDPTKKTLVILGMLRQHDVGDKGSARRTPLASYQEYRIDLSQVLAGALFPCSRVSTPKITMLLLYRHATTSSSLPCFLHAPRV